MVQEIEIKAILSDDKYDELRTTLPKRFKKITEDKITTVRFRPNDVRVRHSDKFNELVVKDGDPTIISREDTTINIQDVEDCKKMIQLLQHLGFKPDPPRTKTKEEFVLKYKDQEYILSLQSVPKFAKILEAEIITESHNDKHVATLKRILTDLGCEPIEQEDFKARIKEYIEENK